uniref:Uncharacterized protein n=1 Tax=Arundo donax TaxID=35708 RepID=A0A0A8Y2U0_ARUDO
MANGFPLWTSSCALQTRDQSHQVSSSPQSYHSWRTITQLRN